MVTGRYFCLPLEDLLKERGFGERNSASAEACVKMLVQCVGAALERCSPGKIRHLITVNTTTVATPSLDAMLMNKVAEIPRDVIRTPLWGLGCAGGVAAIIRAHEFGLGPDECAIILDAEACSLAYLKNDRSRSNLVAASLFGDGAACCVVSGGGGGLRILGHRTIFWDDTLSVMGWDVTDEGLRLKLARSVPDFARDRLRDAIQGFACDNGVRVSDIRYFLSHPGGRKVIEAFEHILPETDTSITWDVLRRYGNMSSVTVFFALREYMDHHFRKGDINLSVALGPGFSCEMVLFRSE